MTNTSPLDKNELRKALGCFVTGVTVVTTKESDGEPRGFTANSFTSVSLDPPLVSVCLSSVANSHAAFAATERFAINLLSEERRLLYAPDCNVVTYELVERRSLLRTYHNLRRWGGNMMRNNPQEAIDAMANATLQKRLAAIVDRRTQAELKLAILEAAMTVDPGLKDVAQARRRVEPVDERAGGVDVDGDGALRPAVEEVRGLPAHYAGGAAKVAVRKHFYPRGTEFLHQAVFNQHHAEHELSHVPPVLRACSRLCHLQRRHLPASSRRRVRSRE